MHGTDAGLLSIREVLAIAGVVDAVAGADSDAGRLAVAWTIRNRVHGSSQPVAAVVGGLCRDLPADARCRCSPAALLDRRCDDGFCRSLAQVALAWADAAPDPTDGAWRFHRHDRLPDWARDRSPTALIGSHFFYAR